MSPRSTRSANVVDGKIYVFGGALAGPAAAYDPAADSWEKKAPVPNRRWWFATSVVDGKIYAIGGIKFNPEKYLDTVEVYNPATDTWEKRTDMPTARCCLSAHTVNGIIYAIGGSIRRGLQTVEAYNPATDTWEQMADMPEPRGGISAVVGEKIYVFTDGWNFTRTVLIYTPPFRQPAKYQSNGEGGNHLGTRKGGTIACHL